MTTMFYTIPLTWEGIYLRTLPHAHLGEGWRSIQQVQQQHRGVITEISENDLPQGRLINRHYREIERRSFTFYQVDTEDMRLFLVVGELDRFDRPEPPLLGTFRPQVRQTKETK